MDSIQLRQNDSARRLLIVFPHPDDETVATGGTLARYAQEGVAAHYVCTTGGEVGTVDADLLKPFEHLPQDKRIFALRQQELRCAVEKLGLAGLHMLGYRDSGMPNSDDIHDPRAFVNADPEQVTCDLVQLMRSIKPQVVVTHDPYGGYGHPDHIFAHQCTSEAFRAAGDATRYPETGAPYAPQKLYWNTFPMGFLKLIVRILPLFRKDPSKFGRNNDVDLREIVAQHNYPITTQIDIWPYIEIKAEAVKCHASQLGTGNFWDRWPRFIQRRLLGYERFTRVEPAPNGKMPVERDLFEGVRV